MEELSWESFVQEDDFENDASFGDFEYKFVVDTGS